MAKATVSRDDFIAAWRQNGGSPQRVADSLGVNIAAVYHRRTRLAKRGIVLHTTPADGRLTKERLWSVPHPTRAQRHEIDIADGVMIVFSDVHRWPGEPTTAERALLALIRQLKPRIVVANGDVFDGAGLSRHDPNGWETLPTVADELAACRGFLDSVEDAAGVDCALQFNLGNHDQRFERYMAVNAPAFQGVTGLTFPEQFPRWQFAMSLAVNWRGSHPVMVKHRNANGIHAAFTNTMKAGVTIVTGHLHRLIVTPWGDYRGRRWGVDTGTLSEPGAAAFNYAEDGPSPACSGFAVLTFSEGRLAPPELVEVIDGEAWFRGAKVPT